MQPLAGIAPPFCSQSEAIDQVNASFYGRFPYPRRPQWLDRALDRDFARRMLNQDLGDWKNKRIPERPAIWVAGCGTNQAVITALAFPDAIIVGTDIAAASLTACAEMAGQLEIKNLELRQENLNQVSYKECFDYIICTGVIHHTADPAAALKCLAAALKPNGVLELMVYNRYHRLVTQPFQKAIRMLCSAEAQDCFEMKLSACRVLLEEMSGPGLMGYALSHLSKCVDVQIADALLQPVEHSYTVETLAEMAGDCGLQLVASRAVNHTSTQNASSWNCRFNNSDMQERYNALDDLERWEITNLLLLEKSPMLWFYCDRRETNECRKPERKICEEFLRTHFAPANAPLERYLMKESGCYERLTRTFSHPPPADSKLKAILSAVSPLLPMHDVLRKAGVPTDFITVNELRLRLTTSAFPSLRAVHPL